MDGITSPRVKEAERVDGMLDMLCAHGSMETPKSLRDKCGTFILSPNSKYQIKGAVPVRVDFRESETGYEEMSRARLSWTH